MSIVAPYRAGNNLLVTLAWAELLSRTSWDWFATLTYRAGVGVGREGLVKDVRQWLWTLLRLRARSCGFRRKWQRAFRLGRTWSMPVYVIGIEPHRSGRLHAHCLIKLPCACGQDRRWLTAAKLWRKRHGMCRIEAPRCQEYVVDYVCKYVAKGGDVEIIGDIGSAISGSEALPRAAAELSASARLTDPRQG